MFAIGFSSTQYQVILYCLAFCHEDNLSIYQTYQALGFPQIFLLLITSKGLL